MFPLLFSGMLLSLFPDKGVYETLVRRSKAIPAKYPVAGYLLFSLSGFSQWVEENADGEMVQLITLDDMYKLANPDF